MPSRRLPLALLGIVVAALAASAIRPYDPPTWWMETAPVWIAIPVLLATWRRFPLTPLAYLLIAFFAVVLIAGGHWTYARVPLGDWIRDAFHLQRNPYDRIGHALQGLVPAVVAREVLLRASPLRRGGGLFAIVVAICLAISALYELLEWATAEIAGGGAVDFLGVQGDVWDAQWDMFLALLGSIASQLLFSRLHDRQLERLLGRPVG